MADSSNGPTPIAIVGVGKIARDAHIPAIASSDRFRLVATADPQGGVDGVANHRSLEALLAAGHEVRAVSLCCPPQMRVELASAALRAGLAVLLEKPPAVRVKDAEEVAKLARSLDGAVLFTAWHSRHAAMTDAARDILVGQTIARGSIVWKEDAERWHPGQDWLWRPGGFGVLDPGINALSILTKIVDGRFSVERSRFVIGEHREAPLAAEIDLALDAARVTADLDFRWRGEEEWTIDLVTTGGRRVRLTDGGARLEVDGEPVASPAPSGEYDRVYQRFADLISRREIDADFEPLRLAEDAIDRAEVREDKPTR